MYIRVCNMYNIDFDRQHHANRGGITKNPQRIIQITALAISHVVQRYQC